MTLLYLVALMLDGIAGFLDAHITDLGIRKGIAVEGNELLTKLSGTVRPKFWQINVYNFGQMLVLSVPGIFGIFYNNNPLIFLSAVMLATDAAGHVKGFFQWRKLGA